MSADIGPGSPPTEPMLITLADAVEHGGRVSRALYPGGQMRLIIRGLLRRDLIDYDDPDEGGPLRVTASGRALLAARLTGGRS